jgi:hypothetical protein
MSALTAVLTFLPEVLDALERRSRARAQHAQQMRRAGENGGSGGEGQVLELNVKLGNVGCAACASAVRAALEASPLVAAVLGVDVDTATAVVELAASDPADTAGTDNAAAAAAAAASTVVKLTAVLQAGPGNDSCHVIHAFYTRFP